MEKKLREKHKKAIRAKVSGTLDIPRVNVFRSDKHIYASLINDIKGETLLWVNDRAVKSSGSAKTKSEKAFLVGKTFGEVAVKKGFKKVVFDRAGYIFHGRVKALAEGARESGLEFYLWLSMNLDKKNLKKKSFK